MPLIYAIVLLVAVAIAVAAFFFAGRAVHPPHADGPMDEETRGQLTLRGRAHRVS